MSKADVETFVEEEVVHDEKSRVDLIIGSEIQNKYKSPLEKRLLRKADLVILPLAALGYFASYLDRNCIGNARLMGLQKDLGMNDNQFFDCLTMYFIGYLVAVGPANVTARKFKPNRSIGGALVFLGASLCGMAAAQNFATIVVLRVLLGAGCSFVQILSIYTSLWYKRDEIGSRVGIVFSAATISGGFGGLMSYGIQCDLTYTATGRHPWSWLFLVFGLIAVLTGILIFTFLPRFPDDLKARNRKHWLFTSEELELATERYSSYNTQGEKIQVRQIKLAFTDPKTYLFGFCMGVVVLSIYTVGSFLPTFIHNFGFTPLRTQLFSVIPFACAFFCVLFTGFMSDYWNTKGPFAMGGITIICIGYIILLATTNTIANVVAACLIVSGCYASTIIIPIWLSINTCGFSKRGAAWAFAEAVGLCFSIMGSRIYTHPPRFVKGHATVLSLNIVALFCACALYFWMGYLNKKKELIQADYVARGELHPHIATNATLEEVGDEHISFKYIL